MLALHSRKQTRLFGLARHQVYLGSRSLVTKSTTIHGDSRAQQPHSREEIMSVTAKVTKAFVAEPGTQCWI